MARGIGRYYSGEGDRPMMVVAGGKRRWRKAVPEGKIKENFVTAPWKRK
ncbi:Os12g0222050 [Oryza sativa Japonica Group]|uniref:Os12g0222050 protein n=1 Tax=Oryza sativa subsp. japonica TaxID=39947 RepID=C7J9K4_ORYSJ|nr:Os12g0222050 [Oryza sativa Japonica Group]|eukprot:NP_001176844.1 Os12g0222050 [Oryza sativa Japonica Group]